MRLRATVLVLLLSLAGTASARGLVVRGVGPRPLSVWTTADFANG